MGLRTILLVAATLLADGDASAGELAGVGDWLGPAGAAVFGAGAVWAGLQRRLDAAEAKIVALEKAAAEVAAEVAKVKAIEDEIERWRRHVRTLETNVDSLRAGVRMMLIALKNDGAPREELLADISSTFSVPVHRVHDKSC